MPERPIDTLLALKALNFVEGLGENDRRVGATLIEHYNRETTRCDPGLERIAKLLGISGRTVIRSVYRLVEAGLFRKIRHGGNFNHNRYEPVWSEFQKIETEWKRRFSEKARSRAPEMSPPGRQPCHLPGDTPVTQTYPNNNLLNETCLKGLPTKERGETFRARVALTHRKQSTSSADAARAAAERRWTEAFHQQFVACPVSYAEALDFIDATKQEAATDAELRRRGGGIDYILKQLRLPTTVSLARDDDAPDGHDPAKGQRAKT